MVPEFYKVPKESGTCLDSSHSEMLGSIQCLVWSVALKAKWRCWLRFQNQSRVQGGSIQGLTVVHTAWWSCDESVMYSKGGDFERVLEGFGRVVPQSERIREFVLFGLFGLFP